MLLTESGDHSLVAHGLWHGYDFWGIEELIIIILITQIPFCWAALICKGK